MKGTGDERKEVVEAKKKIGMYLKTKMREWQTWQKKHNEMEKKSSLKVTQYNAMQCNPLHIICAPSMQKYNEKEKEKEPVQDAIIQKVRKHTYIDINWMR